MITDNIIDNQNYYEGNAKYLPFLNFDLSVAKTPIRNIT